MIGKYFKRIGGLLLAVLMLVGVGLASVGTAEAQGRRRIIVVRSNPFRAYRPFGFGYRNPWYDPFGYYRFDRFNRFGYKHRYSQYVFSNSDKAINQGYKDGFKTGKDDGKKAKSFDPQRSHYYQEAGFGNFGEIYRSGFSRGYQEGYRAGNLARAS
jgi:hypothetical protein